MDHQAGVPQPAGGPPAEGRRRALAQGRAGVLHRRAEEAHLLRRHRRLLPGARRGDAAGEGDPDRQDRRGARVGGGLRRLGGVDRQPRPVPPVPGRARGPAGQVRGRDSRRHRQGEAHVPPDGRAPQRRDRAVRDADGAGLPAGDGGLAARQADPRQRDRVHHAGGRARRPRPLRGLVLPLPGGHRQREGPHAGAAVLGQVRPARQQPRHQLLAGDDAEPARLVPAVAPAHHARPARVDPVPLRLQRAGAAEPRLRPDPVRRAALVLELRDGADDQVRHAGRVDPRVHGRLVAGLPRRHVLQPQRHDADVRDVRQRRRHHDGARPVGRRPGRRRRGRPDLARVVPAAAALQEGRLVHAQQHELHGDRPSCWACSSPPTSRR